MIKVITYGTFDLLHRGHIRLLERAKALGDYLIVGITADTFDRERGKINVQQSLMERIEGVKATGLADEIIVEEYEGQKIDDIKRLDVDIFTVGSDWKGHFDYLNEYCKVVYLDRTQGISSTDIRSSKQEFTMGLLGTSPILNKVERESHYVNGLKVTGIFDEAHYDDLLSQSQAVYIITAPSCHYQHIRRALEAGKHVLVESPVVTDTAQWEELQRLANDRHLVLADGIKTAYSTAFERILLLVKTGVIGSVVSVDATCTSLQNNEAETDSDAENVWNSICAWGPTTLLPIFQILGTKYTSKTIATHLRRNTSYDEFTKVSFIFPRAVASMKVGQGVKSEGELIISGANGYIYVPAPWWKTDYFEIRYENPSENRRFFYPLEGEGLRYELLTFLRAMQGKGHNAPFSTDVSRAIVSVVQDFYQHRDVVTI